MKYYEERKEAKVKFSLIVFDLDFEIFEDSFRPMEPHFIAN